jgi:hypothetical protein
LEAKKKVETPGNPVDPKFSNPVFPFSSEDDIGVENRVTNVYEQA